MTLVLEIIHPQPGEGSERLTTFQIGRGQSWNQRVEVTGPSIRTIQKAKVLPQEVMTSPLCKKCEQTGWTLGWDVLEGTDTSDGSWGKRPQYFIDPFTDPFNKYSPRVYCRAGNGLGSGDSVCCCTSLLTELTIQALHV